MFGLTKREQRWKADQRAAETLAGVVKAALHATAQVAASEAQVAELEALRAENARLRADVAKWQSLAAGFEKACNSAIKSSEILANANRYVWLRDECIESKNPNHTWIVEAPPDMWDEEIDKAMGN